MSAAVGLAAVDVAFAVAGYALLGALGLHRPLGRGARLLGLSFLTGWAFVGVTATLLLLTGFDPGRAQIVFLCLIPVVGWGGLEWRRRGLAGGPAEPAGEGHDRLRWALGALCACLFGVVALGAAISSLRHEWDAAHDFDAFWFWIPKAETIYYAHGLDAHLWRTIVHPQYPPLLAVIDSVTFSFAGGVHPALLPFQRTVFGLAFVLAAFVLLDRFVPRRVSVPCLALILLSGWFWARLPEPMADQSLACLVAIGALVCVIWLIEPRRAWLGLALVFLLAATLTKVEGATYVIALVVVVVVAGVVRHGRRGAGAAVLLVAPLAILPWAIWLRAHGISGASSDYSFADLLDPHYLASHASRLTYAVPRMVRTAGNLLAQASPIGGLRQVPGSIERPAIGLAYATLLVLAARRAPAIAVAVAAWLLLALSSVGAVYWIGRPPIPEYVSVTVNRVEETIVLVALTLAPLLIALALGRVPPQARD
jgi:hypothetical protein